MPPPGARPSRRGTARPATKRYRASPFIGRHAKNWSSAGLGVLDVAAGEADSRVSMSSGVMTSSRLDELAEARARTAPGSSPSTSPSRSRSVAQSPSRRCRGARLDDDAHHVLALRRERRIRERSGSSPRASAPRRRGRTSPRPSPRSTSSIEGPITIRPASRSRVAAVERRHAAERQVRPSRVAPGWRMFSARHTSRRAEHLGSQQRERSASGRRPRPPRRRRSPCRRRASTPIARSPRVRISITSAPVRISAPRAVAAARERVRERAGPAAREHGCARRSAVVAGGVVQEHLRRARAHGAHRRVEDAARRERAADGLLLEDLVDEVGDRHRQRADRLAAGLRAEVAERPARA